MSGAATGFDSEVRRLDPGQLAALVASRLCHDIVSPLGAIGNGVELLELSNPDAARTMPELALVSESVAAARARIATFRLAFGQAGGNARMSRAELEGALRDLSGGGRLRVTLDGPGDAARAEVKMILLALMCLETALPWGGRVLVCRATPGWRLVAEASRTRLDPALWEWLSGGDAEARAFPAPAEVQFPLLAAEAVAQGRAIQWEVDEVGAEVAF